MKKVQKFCFSSFWFLTSILEAVLKLLSQSQSLVDVGARLRAIWRMIAGKPAPTINGLVFV